MKPKVLLMPYLVLVAAMLLVMALIDQTTSLAAEPPPPETLQRMVTTPSAFPLDFSAQPPTQRVSISHLHFDTVSNPPLSRSPVAITANGVGWQRIEFQDFEGDFPDPPLWRSAANMADDGYIYFWDGRDCRALSGSYSAWSIGSSNGGNPACGTAYPNGVLNAMIYGPFDLSQATDAELQFAFWTDIEGDGAGWMDRVTWAASIDDEFYGGWSTSGQTGSWVPGNLNLASVPYLGNLTGQSEVYVKWEFESNASNPTTYEGAFVDDAAVWVYIPPTPTPPPPVPTLPITRHTTLADFADGLSYDGTIFKVEQGDGALTLSAGIQALGAWERLPSLPRELFNFGAVTARGHLFIIGGNSPDGGHQRHVYSASIEDDGLLGHWVETTQLPQALQGHAAVVANEHLFVLGGSNQNGIQSTVFSARINGDGTLGEWNTTLPALLEPLLYHAAVTANGYIYVLGGQKSIDPVVVSGTVYRARVNANGTLGEWEALPTPLPGRPPYLHAAVAACDHLFLIGGSDAVYEWADVYQAVIHADGSLGTWVHTTPLSTPLVAHAAVATHGGILVTGGWGSADPTYMPQKKVYWADLGPDCSLGSWVELTPLPYHTHSHALAVTDRHVYNLGGMTAAPRFYASVLRAPLQFSDSSVYQGVFNHQFHLGRYYDIESLTWTEEGSGDTRVSLRYRVAHPTTGEYGPWSDYTSTNPIPVNVKGGYLEYQLKFEGGSGLSDQHVSEVSLSVSALPSVYLPIVVKD
jgi:hypothetical protein